MFLCQAKVCRSVVLKSIRTITFFSYAVLAISQWHNVRSQSGPLEAEQKVVSLVSINSSGTSSGNAGSRNIAISADGRFVAFTSAASNLSSQIDNNGQPDVFVRDRLNNTTELISRQNSSNFSANGASGAIGPNSIIGISANGRFIVYASQASNLVPLDNNNTVDVFVYDRLIGFNRLVSFKEGDLNAAGNGQSTQPVISANGRVVVFTSSASDLSATNDTNGFDDVYALDLDTLVKKLVSVNITGTNGGNDHSLNAVPSISADGRFIAFESQASDLVSTDTNGGGVFGADVFVRDLQSNSTTLVSVNHAGSGSGNLDSFGSRARISGNGRFVVFGSRATNLVNGISDVNGSTDIFLRDLQAGVTSIVSINLAGTTSGLNLSQSPAISFDGRFVAFTSRASDLVITDTNNGLEGGGGIEDVFVRDMQAGSTKLVSINISGNDSGNSNSGDAEISSDGQFVLFASSATNLTAIADTNSSSDLFLRNLTTNTTLLVSKNRLGNAGGVNAVNFRLSDNIQAAFESPSSILVSTPDTNGALDVFAWGPPPAQLSVNDTTVNEGDSGTTNAVFTVTLINGPTDTSVTVNAVSIGGTAQAGADFQNVSASITFTPGETTKTLSVPIIDDVVFEGNESFTIQLQNASGAVVVDDIGSCTILDNEIAPTLSVNDVIVTEGDEGTTNATFTVTLSGPSALSVGFAFALADGSAVEQEDFGGIGGGGFIFAGNTSQTFNVPIFGDTITEGDEQFFFIISNPSNATVGDNQGVCTIKDNESPTSAPTLQFSKKFPAVSESAGSMEIVVTRSGDTSAVATVDYMTAPITGGGVSDRSDYTRALGTLHFAAGESTKSFTFLLTDDGFVEGNEVVSITLSKPTGGATLGQPNESIVKIIDNDISPSTSNPIDTSLLFVRQHYHDFLNREPDPDGLAFWMNDIAKCGTDAQCIEIKRINVSAAFFLSIEFQETGYLVYRTYKTGFGNLPEAPVPVSFSAFLRDTQQIGLGVQVGIEGWETKLENNKKDFALAFVQRSEFLSAFPNSMSADEFVTKLDTNAGGVLSPAEKTNLIQMLGATSSDVSKRAQVLRAVSEDSDLRSAEFNKAFVLMQYFGYLRRDPNQTPDSDFTGYSFWLDKLNRFGGDFIDAEMVKAFISSIEYRQRFAP